MVGQINLANEMNSKGKIGLKISGKYKSVLNSIKL
jgi:hypothetical protein